jgi:ubiquinone/menaquinone biosynthesis C-methylase UbiE
MEMNEAKQRVLDEVLAAYLSSLHQLPYEDKARVTLEYTHSLHRAWRTLLRLLPVAAGWSILDVGCGLGILSFELAANLRLSVHGVDIEKGFVGHANRLLGQLEDRQLFAVGATVHFSQGDILALDVPDDDADLVFVREVLQFLPDPLEAVRELYRVTKPGGLTCISDTDDQLRITWPAPPAAQSRLVEAFTTLHRQRGGDRLTGRKLSTYLRQVGFDIASVVVLPEAQHRIVDSADVERALIIKQLRAARTSLIDVGAVSEDAFDRDLTELEAEAPHDEFRLNARIVALGRKRIQP